MSIWNVDSLHALIEEKAKGVESQFKAQEEAVKVYKDTSDKWQAASNEWRKAMDDRERNFLSKGMGYVIGALSALALILTIIDKLK